MLIDRSHLSWALFSGTSLTAGAVSYVAYAGNSPNGPSGGSAMGLLFGIIGTLFMLFAGLLAARKPLRVRRIGSAKFWLKGHLWLGTLCIPFILFHAGFGWGGLLEQLMWWSLVTVAASGFFGLAVHQFLPRLLWNQAPLETFESQTPYQCDRMTFISDLQISALCKVPLDVSLGPLKMHFQTLIDGYYSIANGPGERNEKNAAKILLLQQVSPPAVRDYFWAMAMYAKTEARAIRFEGDFPELLEKMYAGLKPPNVESLPGARQVNDQNVTALAPETSPARVTATTKEPKLSPIELMRKKSTEKARAATKTPAVESPKTAVETTDAQNADVAAGDTSKLSPLELMRKKSTEKARAATKTPAVESPKTAVETTDAQNADVAAGDTSKLSPLELMRKKSTMKGRAATKTPAVKTPKAAIETAEAQNADVTTGDTSKLSPLELMRRKTAAKASNTPNVSPLDLLKTNEPKTLQASASKSGQVTPSPKTSVVKDPAVARPAATHSKPVQATLSEKELLREFYLKYVRQFLAAKRTRRSARQSRLTSVAEARILFSTNMSTLPTILHPILNELSDFCEVRRQLDVQRQILRWMHWWLMIHVPAAAVLVVFVIAHVVMALRVIPFHS